MTSRLVFLVMVMLGVCCAVFYTILLIMKGVRFVNNFNKLRDRRQSLIQASQIGGSRRPLDVLQTLNSWSRPTAVSRTPQPEATHNQSRNKHETSVVHLLEMTIARWKSTGYARDRPVVPAPSGPRCRRRSESKRVG